MMQGPIFKRVFLQIVTCGQNWVLWRWTFRFKCFSMRTGLINFWTIVSYLHSNRFCTSVSKDLQVLRKCKEVYLALELQTINLSLFLRFTSTVDVKLYCPLLIFYIKIHKILWLSYQCWCQMFNLTCLYLISHFFWLLLHLLDDLIAGAAIISSCRWTVLFPFFQTDPAEVILTLQWQKRNIRLLIWSFLTLYQIWISQILLTSYQLQLVHFINAKKKKIYNSPVHCNLHLVKTKCHQPNLYSRLDRRDKLGSHFHFM